MSTATTLPVGARTGSYAGSGMHRFRFDPRTWVIGFVSIAAWVSMADALVPLGCCCAALILPLVFSRGVSQGLPIDLRSTLLWIIFAASLTIAFYAVFGPRTGGEAFQVLGFGIDRDSLWLGASMAAKLVALLLLSGALLANVPPLALAAGVTGLGMPLRQIGIPVASFFYLAFFLTRMIPNLIRESHMIALAQRTRGVSIRRWRAYPALALPLFASALRRSDSAALLLASRGFDSRRIPASVQGLRFGTADFVVIAVLTTGWSVWLYLHFR